MIHPDILDMIALARDIKKTTGVTDAVTLRNATEELYTERDVTVDLDGEEWRFILSSDIDKIMEGELGDDEYMLGCFNAWFLASILDIDTEIVKAAQANEGYEALGRSIIRGGHLGELQSAYVSADGYGHHFSSYDGNEHDMGAYIAFRTN